jgi:hypothetical protein
MRAASVDRTLAAAQAWLAGQEAPESVIATHEAGLATSNDGARRWVARILSEQDATGAWGGELLTTAEALLTIHELRAAGRVAEQDPAIGRAHDWIASRRNVAGSWADGCSPDRHRQGLCHHFIGGFFAPAPPDVPYADARLQSGARLSGDSEVRLVSSVTALRCTLSWGIRERDDTLQLAALRHLVRTWGEDPGAGLSTGSLLAAVHALIVSGTVEDGEAAEWGLRLICGKQRGDGSWVETDAFQALAVISAAVDAEVCVDLMRRALWHGARLLIATQQDDGSWGADHGARRALVAWRALRRLEPTTAG